jgi:hypothetical protein
VRFSNSFFTSIVFVYFLYHLVVCVVVLTLYYFIYVRINKQKESRKIWVPPKPKPTLPFGMGPPPEPVEAKDYEATTYKDHEVKLLTEAATAVMMSVLISGFMSVKFESHQALLIQGLMMPFNVYDSVVFKKYILGKTKSDDGSLLYHELYTAPTAESLKIAENVAAARAAAASAVGGVGPDEPRVVELPSEDEEEKEKKAKAKKPTTPATDID